MQEFTPGRLAWLKCGPCVAAVSSTVSRVSCTAAAAGRMGVRLLHVRSLAVRRVQRVSMAGAPA
jgi:hypothetical protein